MGFNRSHTDESKKKISETLLKNPNRGRKKGSVPWNVGKKHSPETIEKIKQSRINRKKKLGYIVSPEARLKISNTLKGRATVPPESILRGNKHPKWKGGVTPYRNLVWNLKQTEEWRNSIFKRDNYTCQICGIRGGVVLNADHIIPFVAIKKKYNLITIEDAINCSELWDINNGRTLCFECHKKTDTYLYKAKNFKYENI